MGFKKKEGSDFEFAKPKPRHLSTFFIAQMSLECLKLFRPKKSNQNTFDGCIEVNDSEFYS